MNGQKAMALLPSSEVVANALKPKHRVSIM